jgi:hypothetical protein
MSQHERETELLTRCIREDNSGELHRQEQKVSQIEGEARCLRRATVLMAMLAGFAIVGASYTLLLETDLTPYQTNLIFHVFRVLAVASFISLLAFAGLWMARRAKLNRERAQSRSLLQKLVTARGVRPAPVPSE